MLLFKAQVIGLQFIQGAGPVFWRLDFLQAHLLLLFHFELFNISIKILDANGGFIIIHIHHHEIQILAKMMVPTSFNGIEFTNHFALPGNFWILSFFIKLIHLFALLKKHPYYLADNCIIASANSRLREARARLCAATISA
jgi:hypothetical protein